MSRHEDQDRFYDLLRVLEQKNGGRRELRSCTAQSGWPGRGVYFFFEDGEFRKDGSPRVTRVGTHAITSGSKTTLWNRLSAHRGVQSSGGGSHRSSIFRLIVGTGLIKRNSWVVSSWGIGTSPSQAIKKTDLTREEIKQIEVPVEIAVTSHIGEMPFLWLEIPDKPSPESLRAVIEQNSIALVSSAGGKYKNQASANWLGYDSNRPKVRESGLWNIKHVEEQYDPHFLDTLEMLIMN